MRNVFIHKFVSIFKTRRNKIIGIIILIVLIFGIWKITNSKPKQPQYQTSQVEKGTLITTVTSSGDITAGASLTVTTNISGIVKEVYVKNGDMVSAGQTIAEITPDRDSQQRQAAAWSNYLSAKNALATAQNNMNTLQSTLFKANQAFVNDKGITNPSDQQKSDPKYIEENAEWLAAETNYKNQTNVITQAQAAVTNSWLSYQQLSSSITAPVSGTITNLTIATGLPIASTATTNSTTNTNTAQQIATIKLPNGKIQATVDLSEIDAAKVKPGQKVTLTLDALPNQTFTGKILLVNTNGSVSSGVTTYPTTIEFDTATDNIYPNMSVNANIITQIKNDVILIPSGAIQTANGQSTVRILKNGKVSTVNVEVGDSNDTQTEITSGLQEGDAVITSVINSTTTRSQSSSSPFGIGNRAFGGGGGNVRIAR